MKRFRTWYGLGGQQFVKALRLVAERARDTRRIAYSELDLAVRQKLGTAQYGFLAWLIGEFCVEKGLPLINSLLTRKRKKLPSDGFAAFLEMKHHADVGEAAIRRHQQESWETFRTLDLDGFLQGAEEFFRARRRAWYDERGQYTR